MSIEEHKQIYDLFIRIEGRLGGIDESLKNLKEQHMSFKKDFQESVDEIEKRTRTLEEFKTNVKTKVGVVASLFGIFSASFISFIKKIFIDA